MPTRVNSVTLSSEIGTNGLEHCESGCNVKERDDLKRIFALAMQAGKVLQRPYIPMLREDNVRKGFFEREQFDAVRRHLNAPLDHAVTLAYYTGWRMASEILPLQWHQIDRAAGVIRLEPGTTKNREGRTFQYRELVEVRDAVRPCGRVTKH